MAGYSGWWGKKNRVWVVGLFWLLLVACGDGQTPEPTAAEVAVSPSPTGGGTVELATAVSIENVLATATRLSDVIETVFPIATPDLVPTPLATAVNVEVGTAEASPVDEPLETQPTATPEMAVGIAMSNQPGEVISLDNVGKIRELARWGSGVINGVVYSADGGSLFVQTSLGYYVHDADNLAEISNQIEGLGTGLLSPDGMFQVTEEGVRDVGNDELLFALPERSRPLGFTPDSHVLATERYATPGAMNIQRIVELWELPDGKLAGSYTDSHVMAFSADWELIALGDYEHVAVRRWREHELLVDIPLTNENPDDIWSETGSLAFSPDGERLAIGVAPGDYYDREGGTIQVHRVSDGQLLYTIGRIANFPYVVEACDSPFYGAHPPAPPFPDRLVYSPDGRLLVATYTEGGRSKLVKIYRAADGELVHEFAGDINSVAFAPDGMRLATGSESGRVYIWGTADLALQETIEGYEPAVSGLVFSPDGRMVAAESLYGVRLRDSQTGMTVQDYPEATTIAFSADQRRMALGYRDGQLELRLANGTLLRTMNQHTDRVLDIAFTPDGETLVSAAQDCTVYLWQGSNGEFLRPLEEYARDVGDIGFTRLRVRDMTISSDGTTLIANLDTVAELGVWRISDGAFLGSFSDNPDVSLATAIFLPDGERLIIRGGGASLSLWSYAERELLARWYLPDTGGNYYVSQFVAAPVEPMVVSSSQIGTVEFWRVEDGTIVHGLSLPTYIRRFDAAFNAAVAFSPDGRILAVGTSEGVIHLWGVP